MDPNIDNRIAIFMWLEEIFPDETERASAPFERFESTPLIKSP